MSSNNNRNILAPQINGRANNMTHGLKEYGNGSMYNGILTVARKAFNKGKKEGQCIGVIAGAVAATVVILAGGSIIFKHKSKKAELSTSENAPLFTEESTNETLFESTDNPAFPWEKIKEEIRKDNQLSPVSYNTWIKPLEYKVYEDRIFVEVPSPSAPMVAYIATRFTDVIRDGILKVTGKNYIVTVVRRGEIVIGDDEKVFDCT